jgi:eukaryotic-like serine/threonine-protein kinase
VLESLIGQTIDGKYRLDAEIGAGGMATIYRATRLQIGDSVAIKVMHTELLRDPQFEERFRREAQAAARLKHPNVVAIYDFGVGTDAIVYLVMELVEGPNLRTIIKETGPMAPALAAEIVRQVCAALNEAHRQNVVHRDIKPANIAVETTPDGPRVKVLDFGIASLRNAGTFGTLTMTGAVLGTPAYMSPEQCLGEELDGRSDIYSLGVVLFEMLCGVVPFNSPTATAVAMQHVQQAPPPLRVLNVSISPAVEAVVLKALAKRREDRYQTARELGEALCAAVAGATAHAGPSPPPAPAEQLDRTIVHGVALAPPPRQPRPPRSGGIATGVLVGALAAGGLGGWFVVHQLTGNAPSRQAAHTAAPAARQHSRAAKPAFPVSAQQSVAYVNQYYRLWNAGQFGAMYGMLSARMQRKNPYDQYVKYHALVAHIDVTATAGSSPDVVNVDIVSRDREKDGSVTENVNAGQWFLAMEGGQLKLDAQKAHQVRPPVVVAAAPVAAPVAAAPAAAPPVVQPAPAADGPTSEMSVAFVQQYYRLWNDHEWPAMYGMLSAGMQRTHPYGDYVKYHSMVVHIDATTTPTSSPTIVAVRIVSQDRNRDGSVSTSVNEGQWYLTTENGSLKLAAQNLHEVGSQAPPSTGRLYGSAPPSSTSFKRTTGLFQRNLGCSGGVQRVEFYNDYTSTLFADIAVQPIDSTSEVNESYGTRFGRIAIVSGGTLIANVNIGACKAQYEVWASNVRVGSVDAGPYV